MDPDILSVPGGVGLFLFGMLAMTGALRGLGSHEVRAILARSSTSPLTGATSGAVTTAVIQSPSAGAAAALDELHGCLARMGARRCGDRDQALLGAPAAVPPYEPPRVAHDPRGRDAAAAHRHRAAPTRSGLRRGAATGRTGRAARRGASEARAAGRRANPKTAAAGLAEGARGAGRHVRGFELANSMRWRKRAAQNAARSMQYGEFPASDMPATPDRDRLEPVPAGAPQRLASRAARIASPMPEVETGVAPSSPSRSAVRTPSASTVSMAFSRRSASAPWSKL